MKILFTTQGESWSSPMDPRFGRAQMAFVYDEQSNKVHLLSNAGKDDAKGAGVWLAAKVLKEKIEVVVTGNGLGEKALNLLQASGVKVFFGAKEGCVKDAYDAYKSGALTRQI